jgi:hypothetical protein
MGLLAGVGAAMQSFGKSMNDNSTQEYARQAELEKEKRIEEQDIRKEQRGIVNKGNERQAELAFETDPANQKLRTDAKLAEAAAGDEYKDSRLESDVKRAGLLARAQHIEGRDTTDYQGRADEHAAFIEKQASNARLRALQEQLRNAKPGEESDKIERLIRIEAKGTADEKGKFTRHAVIDDYGVPTGEVDIFDTNTGESVRQPRANTTSYPVPSQQAINDLAKHPELKDDFIKKFGKLPDGAANTSKVEQPEQPKQTPQVKVTQTDASELNELKTFIKMTTGVDTGKMSLDQARRVAWDIKNPGQPFRMEASK